MFFNRLSILRNSIEYFLQNRGLIPPLGQLSSRENTTTSIIQRLSHKEHGIEMTLSFLLQHYDIRRKD